MIISLFECEKHHYISESFIYLLLCAIATEEPQQSHINIKHPSFSLLSSLSRTLCLFLSHPFLFYLKLCFRSMLAEPVFTYNYGYSFAVLILSFLLSELTGTYYFFKMVGFSIEKRQTKYRSKINQLSCQKKFNGCLKPVLFLGICAIFQFIYYHQYKWDQIEKNNVLENSGISAISFST